MPFICDIQDLWPDTLAATGMVSNRWALKMVGWWLHLVYRLSARVVVLSPGFRRTLIARGVPSEKLRVVYNWAPEAEPLDPTLRQPWLNGLENRFNVVFAGNMGKAQALDNVLEAAALTAGTHPDIQFVFIGGGVELNRLRATAADMGLGNVIFLPRMSFSEVSVALQAADALLVHLRDDPLFSITIPSKTQAYLAAGRPIVMAVDGDAADLVERAQAGIRCRPEDPAAIASAVTTLHSMSASDRRDMGRRGRRFYEEKLAAQIAIGQITENLCEVACTRSGRGR